MDFVDEQHITLFQVGQDGGEVAGLFDHRPGSLADAHPHFIGDDMRQGGFSKTRRAEDQHMVERFATPTGSLDENAHLLAHGFLADVILQAFRPDGPVYGFVFTGFY